MDDFERAMPVVLFQPRQTLRYAIKLAVILDLLCRQFIDVPVLQAVTQRTTGNPFIFWTGSDCWTDVLRLQIATTFEPSDAYNTINTICKT